MGAGALGSNAKLAGLAADSFRWWVVEDTEDQRSRLLRANPLEGGCLSPAGIARQGQRVKD